MPNMNRNLLMLKEVCHVKPKFIILQLHVFSAPPAKLNCTLPEAKQLLMNNPSMETLRNVFEMIRRMLSRDKNPPIDEVVNEGLVVALVQALGVTDRKVQYEAAWALTNVVSGTSRHTQAAVDAGATMALITLAGNTDDQSLVDQCIWAVANIMGDGPMFRNHAIECGVLELLTKCIENLDKLEINLIRTLSWLCSNVCRHKQPQITLEQVAVVLPAIQALLRYDDVDVRQDSGWSLSYLTDTSEEILDLVLRSQILDDVQRCLKSGNDKVAAPALRVVGNFVSGSDTMTQAIIDTNILSTVIPKLLDRNNTSVTKEACWVLSNILAGTPEQVQAVVNAKLIPRIVRCLLEGEFKVKEEAAWALSNLCHSGNHIQIYEMVKCHVLSAAAQFLNLRKVDFIKNLLLIVESSFNAVSTMLVFHIFGCY